MLYVCVIKTQNHIKIGDRWLIYVCLNVCLSVHFVDFHRAFAYKPKVCSIDRTSEGSGRFSASHRVPVNIIQILDLLQQNLVHLLCNHCAIRKPIFVFVVKPCCISLCACIRMYVCVHVCYTTAIRLEGNTFLSECILRIKINRL